jgi:uncharacterized membrane protein YoaK (UPF0700 family)
MTEADAFERHGPKIVVALLLTFASGLVDIVGYLGVFQFFTAHVTGTTVHLGETLVERNSQEIFSAGAIVGAFVVGSIWGRVIIEAGSRLKVRKIATITLAIEAGLLLGLTISALRSTAVQSSIAAQPYWALAILAAAMGMQTATLTNIGPLTVHTTFVTGMINKLAQLLSHIAFHAYDARRKTLDAAALRQWREKRKQAAFLFTIWMFYVGGAAFGTWSFTLLGLRDLFVAVGLLVIAIITDRFAPLSLKEESEHSER